MTQPKNAKEMLDQLGAKWSPDIDDFLDGKIDLAQMRCALCQQKPCKCPEFGTPEYLALLDKRHGR